MKCRVLEQTSPIVGFVGTADVRRRRLRPIVENADPCWVEVDLRLSWDTNR